MLAMCSWPPGISVAEEHDLDFFGAEAKRRLGSDLRDLKLAQKAQVKALGQPARAAGDASVWPCPSCTAGRGAPCARCWQAALSPMNAAGPVLVRVPRRGLYRKSG